MAEICRKPTGIVLVLSLTLESNHVQLPLRLVEVDGQRHHRSRESHNHQWSTGRGEAGRVRQRLLHPLLGFGLETRAVDRAADLLPDLVDHGLDEVAQLPSLRQLGIYMNRLTCARSVLLRRRREMPSSR